MAPVVGACPEYVVQITFPLLDSPKTAFTPPIVLYVSGRNDDGFFELDRDMKNAQVFDKPNLAVECANEFAADRDATDGYKVDIVLRWEKH